MKYSCIFLTETNDTQKSELFKYLNDNSFLPYHLLEFNDLVSNTFNYIDVSLVVFENNNIVGYVPQFIKSNIVESVPWRDKGGPLYDNEEILQILISKTKEIVDNKKLSGFLWKDFCCEYLPNHNYFVNVDIDLLKIEDDKSILSHRNTRNKIKQAEKNKLYFKDITNHSTEYKIDSFYLLFCENRKKLGVPTYSKSFFENLFSSLQEKINVYAVYSIDNKLLTIMIVLIHQNKAIDAYSASTLNALSLRANDFLLYKTLSYLKQKNVYSFDFGADSPLQEGLIHYKMKWNGVKRIISTSYYKDATENDHNIKKYDLIKKVIKLMPNVIYTLFSKLVVK